MMAKTFRTRLATLPDGRTAELVTLANSQGIEVRILTLGATVQSITSPDRQGNRADIALGFEQPERYLANPNYFGVTLGRCANRIAGAQFVLDGTQYHLATNDGDHALHGGTVGFGRKLWQVEDFKEGDANPSVTMTLRSAHGDDGYPGTLSVTAHFELLGNSVHIRYQAVSDAPTLVNLSNHTYFNLGGAANDESVLRHELMIPAESFLPIDRSFIPTGEIRSVAGGAFDFRLPMAIGKYIRDGLAQQIGIGHGYDHCWVFGTAPVSSPRLQAQLYDDRSGRMLEVLSTQPGLQFYSGNFLDGTSVGKMGRSYRQSDGLSLEPQLLPDCPNQPHFGSARLAPGERYENHIVYQLTAQP